jgi:hypothetical protein
MTETCGYTFSVTTKERLRAIIDEMPDGEAEELLSDLEFEPAPMDGDDIASIERGRAQARAGRVTPTDEVFERLKSRV